MMAEVCRESSEANMRWKKHRAFDWHKNGEIRRVHMLLRDDGKSFFFVQKDIKNEEEKIHYMEFFLGVDSMEELFTGMELDEVFERNLIRCEGVEVKF